MASKNRMQKSGGLSARILVVLGTALFASSAQECFADEKALANACADIQVSQQVDECISKQYDVSDKDLNDIYKNLLKKIDEDYKTDQKLGGELRDLLKKTQLSWIKYRDANCEVRSFEVENSKPAKSEIFRRCLTDMTQERISELNRIFLGAYE